MRDTVVVFVKLSMTASTTLLCLMAEGSCELFALGILQEYLKGAGFCGVNDDLLIGSTAVLVPRRLISRRDRAITDPQGKFLRRVEGLPRWI